MATTLQLALCLDMFGIQNGPGSMSWLQSVNFQSVQPCASEHMFHQICFSSHTRYIWISRIIWYMLCMEGLLLEDFNFGRIRIWPPHLINFSFIPSIRIFPTFPMLQQQLRVAKAWCYVILKRCTTFGSLDRPGQRLGCWWKLLGSSWGLECTGRIGWPGESYQHVQQWNKPIVVWGYIGKYTTQLNGGFW